MSEILGAAKGTWERHRVRQERGWISRNLLSLRFAGKPSQSDTDIIYMEVILQLKGHKPVVKSCHEIVASP
jgi:hypothetical protein